MSEGTYTEGPPEKPFTFADLEKAVAGLKEELDRADTLESPVFTEFRSCKAGIETFKGMLIKAGIKLTDDPAAVSTYRGIPIVADEFMPEGFILMVGPKHFGWLNLESGEMIVSKREDIEKIGLRYE
jgi:hypothetical protein